jgi:hypothetical protein
MDRCKQVVQRLWTSATQEGFEFAESVFDRREIRRIDREKEETSASSAHGMVDNGGFVTGQVIEDDNIARTQDRNKQLAHKGRKHSSIDSSIPASDILLMTLSWRP